MLKSETIKKLLELKTHADLASLYHAGMEVQVNVAQDGGDRVDGEYKGKGWHAWTDGFTTWKPFRIPLNAGSEPVDCDGEIKFDLFKHAEGIGMTGWNWKEKKSIWVAFDFDSISGHSDKHQKKLEAAELEALQQAVKTVPWVTLRASTGGSGLHLYVFLADPPTTQNHTEHAALARAILGKLSAITGFDFSSKVDVCGGNMWVWHRKLGESLLGLRLLRQGIPLDTIPINWQDHIGVISGSSNRSRSIPKSGTQTLPTEASERLDTEEELFRQITSQRTRTPLDAEHKALIEFLEKTRALWWWDQDRHMLTTHTIHLKEAHQELGMRGAFDTLAQGTERGADQNCFLFPLRNGAWAVRRHTPGVQEALCWDQDGTGYTKCTLNQAPDLKSAARALGGVENKKGEYVFDDTRVALTAAKHLGINVEVPSTLDNRKTKLKETKDGRISIEIEDASHAPKSEMSGWLLEKTNYTRIFNVKRTPQDQSETENYDDVARHLISEQKGDYGWAVNVENNWITEPLNHVSLFLGSRGIASMDVKKIIGGCIARPWTLVNRPFEPEYVGDRKWNRDGAQLRFAPSRDKDTLVYPTWMKMLEHIGESLTEKIKLDPWCKDNLVVTGADYLKLWIASMFQRPYTQLPYLFLHGSQNSGKSILYESLSLLMTKGFENANNALTSQGNFNGELEGAILCYVEEINLSASRVAYARLKEWVTCLNMPIHAKGGTPFGTPNTSHWIQTANTPTDCPVLPGDTRIVVISVNDIPPEKMIPKGLMIQALEKEAPDFLAEIFKLQLPDNYSRLGLPVIMTDSKAAVQSANSSLLEQFVAERVSIIPGAKIRFSDFYTAFARYLDSPEPIHDPWSKIHVAKQMALLKGVVKGRISSENAVFLGNVTLDPNYPPGKPFVYATNAANITQHPGDQVIPNVPGALDDLSPQAYREITGREKQDFSSLPSCLPVSGVLEEKKTDDDGRTT